MFRKHRSLYFVLRVIIVAFIINFMLSSAVLAFTGFKVDEQERAEKFARLKANFPSWATTTVVDEGKWWVDFWNRDSDSFSNLKFSKPDNSKKWWE